MGIRKTSWAIQRHWFPEAWEANWEKAHNKRTGRRGRKVLQDKPRCSRKRSVRKAEHWIWNSMEDPQTKIEMETIPSAHESTFVPSKQEVETAGLQVLAHSWRGMVWTCALERWKMVCIATWSESQKWRDVGTEQSPFARWMQKPPWAEGYGLVGCGGREMPPSLVHWVGEWWLLPPHAANCGVASDKTQGNSTAALVPARRGTSARYHVSHGLPSFEVRWPDHQSQKRQHLAPIQPWPNMSRLQPVVQHLQQGLQDSTSNDRAAEEDRGGGGRKSNGREPPEGCTSHV